MKVIIGMGHPKDVHLWKNVIRVLEEHGHEVRIVAWDKDVTLDLLDIYGFKYEILGKSCKSIYKKAYRLLISELISLKVVSSFKADLFLGREPCLTHVSKLVRKPHILFPDTEHASLSHWLTFPFSDIICTSTSYNKPINKKKHVTFNGYQELSYLHPNYYTPDPSILNELGLKENEKYIVLRFVAWEGSHDIGHHGMIGKKQFVECLEKYAKVYIISEGRIETELEKYRLKIMPEKVHDLLYYASLYLGEGATMATEAAILGTPSIYISSLAGKLGYLDELETQYEIVYSFKRSNDALTKAIQILEEKNTKILWEKKKERLFNEKADVVKYLVGYLESYS
ncbi:MAG: hypothetical protein JG777_1760 [Clostridia bacterium]|jgi:hypothetical protein|nr:hypothetical protein [Clostridia bacterium]